MIMTCLKVVMKHMTKEKRILSAKTAGISVSVSFQSYSFNSTRVHGKFDMGFLYKLV